MERSFWKYIKKKRRLFHYRNVKGNEENSEQSRVRRGVNVSVKPSVVSCKERIANIV